MANVSLNLLVVHPASSFLLSSSLPSSFLLFSLALLVLPPALHPYVLPEGIGLSVTRWAVGYPRSMSAVNYSSDLRSTPQITQVQAFFKLSFSMYVCLYSSHKKKEIKLANYLAGCVPMVKS